MTFGAGGRASKDHEEQICLLYGYFNSLIHHQRFEFCFPTWVCILGPTSADLINHTLYLLVLPMEGYLAPNTNGISCKMGSSVTVNAAAYLYYTHLLKVFDSGNVICPLARKTLNEDYKTVSLG